MPPGSGSRRSPRSRRQAPGWRPGGHRRPATNRRPHREQPAAQRGVLAHRASSSAQSAPSAPESRPGCAGRRRRPGIATATTAPRLRDSVSQPRVARCAEPTARPGPAGPRWAGGSARSWAWTRPEPSPTTMRGRGTSPAGGDGQSDRAPTTMRDEERVPRRRRAIVTEPSNDDDAGRGTSPAGGRRAISYSATGSASARTESRCCDILLPALVAQEVVEDVPPSALGDQFEFLHLPSATPRLDGSSRQPIARRPRGQRPDVVRPAGPAGSSSDALQAGGQQHGEGQIGLQAESGCQTRCGARRPCAVYIGTRTSASGSPRPRTPPSGPHPRAPAACRRVHPLVGDGAISLACLGGSRR